MGCGEGKGVDARVFYCDRAWPIIRSKAQSHLIFEVPAVEVMFAIHITQVQRRSVRPLRRCGPSPPMTCLTMMW